MGADEKSACACDPRPATALRTHVRLKYVPKYVRIFVHRQRTYVRTPQALDDSPGNVHDQ